MLINQNDMLPSLKQDPSVTTGTLLYAPIRTQLNTSTINNKNCLLDDINNLSFSKLRVTHLFENITEIITKLKLKYKLIRQDDMG